MKPIKLFFIIICCLTSSGSFAQNPNAIEADLLKSFKKISYWRTKLDGATVNANDSLEKVNEIFEAKLKDYTNRYPSTIDMPFALLKSAQMNIYTSTDGLFRVYSWETWLGGTMRDFGNLFQYKFNNKTNSDYKPVDASDEGAPTYWFSNLYTFTVKGKAYYLVVYNGIYSTKDAGQGIRIYAIEDGKLNDNVKLIKTAKGLHNKLYYDYDFFSVVDWAVRPAITFDATHQTIKIPLVAANGKVSHNYITYKFTGQYFERVKN